MRSVKRTSLLARETVLGCTHTVRARIWGACVACVTIALDRAAIDALREEIDAVRGWGTPIELLEHRLTIRRRDLLLPLEADLTGLARRLRDALRAHTLGNRPQETHDLLAEADAALNGREEA